jgi:8-amino-7-oxononanoate synthase
MNIFQQTLQLVEETGLYPESNSLSGPQAPIVHIRNDQLIMFCSNNYLNLSTHKDVVEAAAYALFRFGTGSGGSRHVSGTNNTHLELEKQIAQLKGSEDALVFSSGYLANIAAISALANPLAGISVLARPSGKERYRETVVFSDELNHASIVDGCRIAGRKCIRYKHADMYDLSQKMKEYPANGKIIVTDGVFSMDGDIAPLPDIVDLAKNYNAFTIVDDAHATGILGKTGGGTAEYFGIGHHIDLQVGTLNKVFGAIGGFIAGDKKICKLLRAISRPYIFSASMPPSVAAGLSAAISVIRNDDTLRQQLFSNIHCFKQLIKKTSINVNSEFNTPIIPVIIGDGKKTLAISKALYKKGFFVPAVTWPAVPKGKARLRVTLMSQHSEEQIHAFVDALDTLNQKIK